MFYRMTFDYEKADDLIENNEGYIIANETNVDEIDMYGYEKGFFGNIIYNNVNIDRWPYVYFKSNNDIDNTDDFLINIKSWPIVSCKAKRVFEKIKGASFYPVYLENCEGKRIKYYLLYIENFIDAYDMEKSKYVYNAKYDFYTFIPGKIYLNKENCKKYDIFRCIKNKPEIYISENLKNMIENNLLTGFKFYKQH